MKLFVFKLTLSVIIQFFLGATCFSQISICSWNVQNFGKSKTPDQLSLMANILKEFDIIALQEINTSPDGAQKLVELVSLLNQKSAFKWYYNISNPTTSAIVHEKERYAYIWKQTKTINAQKGYLDTQWQQQIVREPFIKQFTYKEKSFVLINYHAVPKKKNPSQEIALFKQYPQRFTQPFIILGDFNIISTDQVWQPLIKQNYTLALINKKTTLRQQCINNDCLANGFDNFVYSKNNIKVLKAGTIPFYKEYKLDMAKARKLSDHLPIFIEIEL